MKSILSKHLIFENNFVCFVFCDGEEMRANMQGKYFENATRWQPHNLLWHLTVL